MAKAKTAQPVAKDELKAAAEELMDEFVNGKPEGTLAFAARLAAERARAHTALGVFPLRSINNRLYLEAQVRRRHADVKYLFAGSKQWAAMGREVVADEEDKSYKIWGRPVYTVKDEEADGTIVEKEVFRRGGAPICHVYDWTQTRSLNPDYVEPDWETPLAAGDFATLHQLVASAPVPVLFEDLAAQNYHGYYDGAAITIDGSAPVGNQIVELARQLSHHYLGHPPAHTRAATVRVGEGEQEFTVRYVSEQEAALAGWLVARSLGLDETVGNEVTKQCAEYLHRWTKFNPAGDVVEIAHNSKKGRRALVADRLNTALKAADAIIGAYCAAGVVDDALAADPVAV